MPKLNREKLSYKKEVRTVEKVRSNSFYDPIYSDDEYSKQYRGYHTYDYFGPKEDRDDKLS